MADMPQRFAPNDDGGVPGSNHDEHGSMTHWIQQQELLGATIKENANLVKLMIADHQKAKNAHKEQLRTISDVLFEHRESMNSEAFKAINDALKSAHDQI